MIIINQMRWGFLNYIWKALYIFKIAFVRESIKTMFFNPKFAEINLNLFVLVHMQIEVFSSFLSHSVDC